jgi:hypothetical protein
MNKKKVNFKREVLVYLVPSVKDDEYKLYKQEVWWSKEENNESFKDAIKEINELMSRNTSMEKKHAIKLLYQPGNISYKKENFE